MSRKDREALRVELEKLGKIREEGPEYFAQNRKVAAAEKKVSKVENLWARAQVD